MKMWIVLATLLLVLGFGAAPMSFAASDDVAIEPLLGLIEEVGRNSPDGAIMVWVGHDPNGLFRPGVAAGVYLYAGTGVIHYRLEEWIALLDGRFQTTVWKFYHRAEPEPDRASVTEFIRDPRRPGVIETPRYEEPIMLDSPEGRAKAAKAVEVLLAADREKLRRLPADVYMRFAAHH